jgi:hypothetical protein
MVTQTTPDPYPPECEHRGGWGWRRAMFSYKLTGVFGGRSAPETAYGGPRAGAIAGQGRGPESRTHRFWGRCPAGRDMFHPRGAWTVRTQSGPPDG